MGSQAIGGLVGWERGLMSRSLLDLANAIAGERHDELVEGLADAARRIAANGDGCELAATLAEEALELLHGPRPGYGEAAAALSFAAQLDYRFRPYASAARRHFEDSCRLAMTRTVDERPKGRIWGFHFAIGEKQWKAKS